MKNKKPQIKRKKTIFQSRIFKVEEIFLHFNNGQKRIYERVLSTGRGAVLIVPLLDSDTLLMIKEYAAGTDRYELAFPKGKIDKGENFFDASVRELQEEVGFLAKKITKLKNMSIAPGYLSHVTTVVLAEDLQKSKLIGDEPEPIEVVKVKFSQIKELIEQENFSEARSIAAFYLTAQKINKNVF
jgi:ADP-ribose diphosphatase